jgi:hypothetical protein
VLARAAVAAAALGALAAALLVAGCGSGVPLRAAVVTVVPASGSSAGSWRWTSACSLGPVLPTGCADGGPIRGAAQLNGDEWNLGGPANAGAVEMSIGAGGAVSVESHFARTLPCTGSECLAPSANTWVRGYPNVLYGIDPCRADSSPRSTSQLPLPIRVDRIPPDLIGVTGYSSRASAAMYDAAYDLWLNPTDSSEPCRTTGTLELVVMTDYADGALPPDSLRVGTAEIPSAAGSAVRPGGQRWGVYATNIGGNGWTASWGGTLWFVPAREDTVERGRVSVDLGAVLAETGRLLETTFGWPEVANHYWLDTAAFGFEYGPPSGDPLDAGPSDFSARISAYCLAVGSTVGSARCE